MSRSSLLASTLRRDVLGPPSGGCRQNAWLDAMLPSASSLFVPSPVLLLTVPGPVLPLSVLRQVLLLSPRGVSRVSSPCRPQIIRRTSHSSLIRGDVAAAIWLLRFVVLSPAVLTSATPLRVVLWQQRGSAPVLMLQRPTVPPASQGTSRVAAVVTKRATPARCSLSSIVCRGSWMARLAAEQAQAPPWTSLRPWISSQLGEPWTRSGCGHLCC